MYSPPEQFGFGQTDVRSDVYALGMLLFFCLTGREASGQDRAFGFACEGVPEPLRRVIAQACAFDPAVRFFSAQALGAAFDAELGECQRLASGVMSGLSQSPEDSSEHCEHLQQQFGLGSEIRAADSSTQTTHGLGGRLKQFSLLLSKHVSCWVGVVRNTFIVLMWLVLIATCVSLTVSPTPANQGYPTWYLAWVFLGFVAPMVTAIAYVVADRRSLRRWLPRLGAIPVWAEFGGLIVLFLLLFMLVGLATVLKLSGQGFA